jgi:hypothetical protein
MVTTTNFALQEAQYMVQRERISLFNRRFWEDQLFDRLLAACTNCESTTYAELTQ